MTRADGVSQHNIAVFGMLIGHKWFEQNISKHMKTRKSGKQTNKQTISSLELKYSDSFLCRIPERT